MCGGRDDGRLMGCRGVGLFVFTRTNQHKSGPGKNEIHVTMTYSWSLFWIWKQHTGARAMRNCIQRGAPVRKPLRGILQKHSHECSRDSPRPALQAKYGSADRHGQREYTLSPYFQRYQHSYISNPAFVDLCQKCTSNGTPRKHVNANWFPTSVYLYFVKEYQAKRQRSANTVCCAMSKNKSSHTAVRIRHLPLRWMKLCMLTSCLLSTDA